MKTSEQLKGTIRNTAVQKNLRPQEVLQMLLFERVLECLTSSHYWKNFILKGGLLISSVFGIEERTIIDMDTTVRGIRVEESEITPVIKEILSTDVGDGIDFSFRKIEPIREDDTYSSFRVRIDVRYGKINSPTKLDTTAGDKIALVAVQYDYPLLFEHKTVPVMAYTLEMILTKKYETITRRNIGTTRTKDFYDLYTLHRERHSEIRPDIPRMAVAHTAKKRDSTGVSADWEEILQDIREEPTLVSPRHKYTVENPYIGKFLFSEVLDIVERIGRLLQEQNRYILYIGSTFILYIDCIILAYTIYSVIPAL